MKSTLSTLALGLTLALPACTHIRQSGPSTQSASIATTQSVESKADKDARMKWWRESRFGMFIHWGIYAVPAGVYRDKPIGSIGEWIMNNGSIPVAEYADYAKQFNPVKFNAEEYVALAKSAGMKYIIITSKHHDGFAMFKSRVSPFNIVDATPFKRDVIKELEIACHKTGMRFGVYYSQSQDWHHPGGFSIGRDGRKDNDHWDPAQAGSFDDYINQVAVPQARELLSNYQLDVLWWDTPGPITREQATRLHDLLAMQPKIITNNRLQNVRTPGSYQGDTETPEQRIPANGYPGGRDFEVCMTVNETWGYKSTDTNFKSTQTLLRNLIDIASKGGNYLLNVGPMATGEIPVEEVERLREMGKWLAINGEAVYGTTPNPFPPPPPTTAPASAPVAVAPTTTPTRPTTRPRTPVVWDWRATSKPGKIYLHIFQWPTNGTFTPPKIEREVTRAYLLSDGSKTPLPMTSTKPGVYTITVPKDAPDPIASVICLELKQL